jgi:hypothetical protein
MKVHRLLFRLRAGVSFWWSAAGEKQRVLAVDWIDAIESGFLIVCDRCRALPF